MKAYEIEVYTKGDPEPIDWLGPVNTLKEAKKVVKKNEENDLEYIATHPEEEKYTYKIVESFYRKSTFKKIKEWFEENPDAMKSAMKKTGLSEETFKKYFEEVLECGL